MDTGENINTLTHHIIGCAMTVHNILGNGFQEKVYQRALAIEFSEQCILFQRELEMPLQYKGQGIGSRRVDFLVEEKVMLEIKAVEKLNGAQKAQAINYCEAYNIADVLLINFGVESLTFNRVYNKKFKRP